LALARPSFTNRCKTSFSAPVWPIHFGRALELTLTVLSQMELLLAETIEGPYSASRLSSAHSGFDRQTFD